ncbi:germinal-center associated nuclear protein-like [Actinia tenebrosa]|uniref:Germinal-center associated nuclear protein-like n=1 Tax=Actinia tenebrosa TaxID=6105 RepID=A0A6P8HP34_ACTTE|nr:germinal-center associated nuclear protein-like [Actinia tenebrosa]
METGLSEVIVGSCLSMCPAAERNARQRQGRLHVFEMPSDQYPNHPIKEFCRSAAGKQIHHSELRPAHVLLTTMEYLLNEIVDRKDQPWTTVYHYVFDRIRAVRQDMVIQRIEDESAVEILEKAARFHIYAGFHLCETSIEHFDPRINDNHIQECLKRLLVLYKDLHPHSLNRAEFEAYYLLHNLGSHEAMEHSLRLPQHIKCQPNFKAAWNISLMKLVGNFVRLFRLVRSLPFLASCLVQKHFPSIYSTSIAVLNTAYSDPKCQFPVKDLSSILLFNNEQEAQMFLVCFGIEVSNGYIKFSKKSYTIPEKLPARVKCRIKGDKMTDPVKKILQHDCSPVQVNQMNYSPSNDQERESQQNEKQIEETKKKPGSGRGRGRGLNVNPKNKPVGRGRSRGRIT